MNKTHRLMVAGIGAMTPAFIATDQLQARAAEGAAIALSPTEKLRIAGDRIRLAAKAKVSTQSSVRGVPPLAQPRKDPFPLSYGCRTYAMCARAPRKAR